MNAFSAFAAALCAACVLIGALHLITPDGAMSKPVKYALSVVFLISVISAAAIPLKKTSVDITVPDCEEYSEESLYATSAEYVYGQLLKNAGIEFTKITVCTDKSDDGSIIISKVTVFSGRSAAEIKRALGVVAENYEVEVINGQID